MPRSATTIMLNLVCDAFDLNYFGEVCTGRVNDRVPPVPHMVPWLQQQKHWGIKFLTGLAEGNLVHYLRELDTQYVVIMRRDNLVDNCLSQYWATTLDQYHYRRPALLGSVKPRKVPMAHVEWWLEFVYLTYLQELRELDTLDVPKVTYSQEYLEANGAMEINGTWFSVAQYRGPTVASGIHYPTWTRNYQEIQDRILKFQSDHTSQY